MRQPRGARLELQSVHSWVAASQARLAMTAGLCGSVRVRADGGWYRPLKVASAVSGRRSVALRAARNQVVALPQAKNQSQYSAFINKA